MNDNRLVGKTPHLEREHPTRAPMFVRRTHNRWGTDGSTLPISNRVRWNCIALGPRNEAGAIFVRPENSESDHEKIMVSRKAPYLGPIQGPLIIEHAYPSFPIVVGQQEVLLEVLCYEQAPPFHTGVRPDAEHGIDTEGHGDTQSVEETVQHIPCNERDSLSWTVQCDTVNTTGGPDSWSIRIYGWTYDRANSQRFQELLQTVIVTAANNEVTFDFDVFRYHALSVTVEKTTAPAGDMGLRSYFILRDRS